MPLFSQPQELNMKQRERSVRVHSAAAVPASFILVIIIGSVLLMLPFSLNGSQISFLDALFTSASAVCVTGLIVADTGSFFSAAGQSIILALIQIGGIGVMTISVVLFRWLRKSVSYRQRAVMQNLLTHTPRQDIYRLLFSVVKFTVIIELTGAVLLVLVLGPFTGNRITGSLLFTALFHAVSAFCNAGFSLFSDSLMRFDTSVPVNAIMSLLIISGGLGFPVLYEIEQRLMQKENKKLSIQTKAVLSASALLILFGAFAFAFAEYLQPIPDAGSSVNRIGLLKRIVTALFQSVTARTAGFNTLDIGSVGDAGLAVLMFLMFIGASPGSCGGGVKTTTLAVLVAGSISRIRGSRRVNLYKKSLPEETVNRSLILIVLSCSIIALVFFMLLILDGNSAAPVTAERGVFLPLLFETLSAFGTVGLSMGVTAYLSSGGKAAIIMTMLIGRVGILTFSYIVTSSAASNGIEYSEENIMIG